MSLPLIKIHAWGRRLILFATILTAVYFFKLWQPARQIELHQKNLLLAVESHRWGSVKSQLAADYTDRFGHTRDSAISDLREVVRSYFVLTIKTEGSQMRLTANSATVTTNLTLTGTGTAATEWISNEVNRLPSPWIFTWRKASFWPWDWQLVTADNASLNATGRPGDF